MRRAWRRYGAYATMMMACAAFVTATTARSVCAQAGETPLAQLIREGYAKRQAGDLSGAIAMFERAVSLDGANTSARLQLGYALLAADRVPPAIEQFRAITKNDPGNVLAHRQLALLLSARGDLRAARDELEAARALGGLVPTDWVELGRVQGSLGDVAEARKAFESALATGDSTAKSIAALALENLARKPLSSGGDKTSFATFVEFYSAPLYQSRFDLTTAQGTVRLGIQPLGSWRWTPYASLRVVTDSRSVGGPQGLRYSENVAASLLGFRVQPWGARLTIYAEGGPAFPVVRESEGRRPSAEARAGAYLYNAWQWGDAKSSRLPRRIEMYADANYLHRFEDDVFASILARGVLELARGHAGTLEAFTKISAVTDRRRFAWANVGEGSLGITIVPGATRRFVLMAEQVEGVYVRDTAVPGKRTYADFRLTGVLYLYSRLGH